jgi:hypothetical protein
MNFEMVVASWIDTEKNLNKSMKQCEKQLHKYAIRIGMDLSCQMEPAVENTLLGKIEELNRIVSHPIPGPECYL